MLHHQPLVLVDRRRLGVDLRLPHRARSSPERSLSPRPPTSVAVRRRSRPRPPRPRDRCAPLASTRDDAIAREGCSLTRPRRSGAAWVVRRRGADVIDLARRTGTAQRCPLECPRAARSHAGAARGLDPEGPKKQRDQTAEPERRTPSRASHAPDHHFRAPWCAHLSSKRHPSRARVPRARLSPAPSRAPAEKSAPRNPSHRPPEQRRINLNLFPPSPPPHSLPTEPPQHRARPHHPQDPAPRDIPPRGGVQVQRPHPRMRRAVVPRRDRQKGRLHAHGQHRGDSGAFYTLVPIRPRWRCERRSLRTLPGASLRPPLAFNPRPRRLSTPTDAFQLHPDVALYGTALRRGASTRGSPGLTASSRRSRVSPCDARRRTTTSSRRSSA